MANQPDYLTQAVGDLVWEDKGECQGVARASSRLPPARHVALKFLLQRAIGFLDSNLLEI